MALLWTREQNPRWDADKQRVFGPAGPAALGFDPPAEGTRLADQWWRVQDAEIVEPIGYGRLDNAWGDAEILVGVDPDRRRTGVGGFVLEHLEGEARGAGLNYLFNTVPADHPNAPAVVAWLGAHGFTEHGPGEYRKRVTPG